MLFALSVFLLVSLCLPNIHGNDVNNATETNHTLVVSNRPLHRDQTKTTRNDQLLSVLAARRREIIQKRFKNHLRHIVDISSGNSSSLDVIPKQIPLPNNTKTINVHLNLSNILLQNSTNITEDQNVHPSTESNVVNVSSPRNAQKRKSSDSSQTQESKSKNMPIIRNILYRRKMSFLNRKLPLDLEHIAYDAITLSDANKSPEDLIFDNEDSLQVEESSHDKLIYYDVKNNVSKNSANNFDDTSEEIKSMSINNKTMHNNRKNFNTTVKPENVTISNMTEITVKLNKTDIKPPKNNTRFMSPSLYSYFRPLDVPEEEMQPFLNFGDKLPNRNQSVDKTDERSSARNEEEVHENMDVTDTRQQIENKIAKVNLPAQKVPVSRDNLKNRISSKKNVTENVASPKVDKKVYNYRNIPRNRGFRNSTIFVQNKRSGVRHTINLRGNSSIANLKPITASQLIQNSSISTKNSPKFNLSSEIVISDKTSNLNATEKIESTSENIAIVLPEKTTHRTKSTREQPNDSGKNRTISSTENYGLRSRSTSQQNLTTEEPSTTTVRSRNRLPSSTTEFYGLKSTTTLQSRTVRPKIVQQINDVPVTESSTTLPPRAQRLKLPNRTNLASTTETYGTTSQPISTRTTEIGTKSTTTSSPRMVFTTNAGTTSVTTKASDENNPFSLRTEKSKLTTQSQTTATKSTTEKTAESTTTSSTAGLFSTAVVTSVSIESSKSRNNATKIEKMKNITRDNLDLDATVISTLFNYTSQGFQNNNPVIYPRMGGEIPINITRNENKKLFILRPTTDHPTTKEFVINVPDVETTVQEIAETSIKPEMTEISNQFNTELKENTEPTTKMPSRVFNTTLNTQERELELPLATLFSVTDFKKPEISSNKTTKSPETVISRKSESDVSIDNIHAAYILAALGFLPMMVIVIYVIRSVMKKKNKIIDDYEAEMHDSDKKSIIHPVARLPTLVLDPSNKWEFPRSKLRLQTVLGQGNFGQVWKAEADDLKGHVGLTRLVAVKTIKDGAGTKERDDLLKELAIMQKMGSHPNVVTLLGCCTEKEPYLLIMEYVMYGKLLTFLRDHRTRRDYYNFSDDAATLTARDLTVFAYCVARGMEYLTSKGIIHRDLAARNILVDHNKLCKIADFGMSRDASATGGEVNEPRAPRNALPVRWMAVESLLYSVFTHKTDVWAFGVLLWEIVTLGSSPYANMSGREVMRLVCAGYRLERPGHCRPELYEVMARTWNADASARPTFAELRADLAALLEQPHPDGSYVDLESFRADPTVYEIDNCTPRGNYFTVKSRFSEFECDI